MKLILSPIWIIMLMVFLGCNNPESTLQTKIVHQDNFSEGEKLFDNKCSLCHLKSVSYEVQGIVMTGPDMHILSKQVRQHFTNNQGVFDQEKANKFIIDYVFLPDETKSLLPDSITDKFGLMPSLKGSVTAEELQLIADFILKEQRNEEAN